MNERYNKKIEDIKAQKLQFEKSVALPPMIEEKKGEKENSSTSKGTGDSGKDSKSKSGDNRKSKLVIYMIMLQDY